MTEKKHPTPNEGGDLENPERLEGEEQFLQIDESEDEEGNEEVALDDQRTIIRRKRVPKHTDEEVRQILKQERKRLEQQQPLTPYNTDGMQPDNRIPQKPSGGLGQGSPMFLFIVMAILAAVMAYGVMTFLGVPKNNYKSDVTRLELDIVDVRDVNNSQATGITTLQTDVTNLKNANSTQQPNTQLIEKVTELETQLLGFDEKLVTAETDLSNWLVVDLPVLQEQVDALGTASNFDATYLETDIATVQTDVETVTVSQQEQAALVDTIRIELTAVQGQIAGGTGEPVDLSDIENQLILLEADMTGIGTDLIALQTQLDTLNASVVVLTQRVAELETITQSYILVEPTVSSLYINLFLTAGTERVVTFQVTAIPTGDVPLGSGTYGDTLKALYTTPPLALSALGGLIPAYEIGWWGSEWHLVSTVFNTPATTIPQGESGKSLTYSGTYNFRVLIETLEIGEYETGGVW